MIPCVVKAETLDFFARSEASNAECEAFMRLDRHHDIATRAELGFQELSALYLFEVFE